MIGAAFAVTYVIIGMVINIIGNLNLLLGFFVVSTIFGIASQYVEGLDLIQVFMGIFLIVGTCVGIINTIVVDLYPTNMRGMALAISLMAGRFGAVTGSHITGPLIYSWCEFTFYVFGADHLGKELSITYGYFLYLLCFSVDHNSSCSGIHKKKRR